MKKIYCIEQWLKSNDDHFRDGSFWGIMEDPWKCGAFDIVNEFDNEEDFKNEIKYFFHFKYKFVYQI